MFTQKEVAAQFKVSVLTVKRWIYSGRLKACKFGRTVRISPQQIARFIHDSEIGRTPTRKAEEVIS